MNLPGPPKDARGRSAAVLRKTAGCLLRLAISVGLIYYIFSRQETSIARVAQQARALDPLLILLGLLGFKACILLGSFRWQMLMRAHNIQVGFADALALNYIGMFFNNFMLSLTGGDIIKAYYASKLEREKKAASATIVFLDRVIGLAGLVFTGAVSALFAACAGRQVLEHLVIAASLLGCAVLALVVFNEKAARKLGRLIVIRKLRPPLKKVHEAVYHYKNSKRTLLAAFGISILLWCSLIWVNIVIGRGLGIEASAADYFAYVPVIILISSVPASIRGWGIREYFYGKFFGFGSGPTLSIIFALLEVAWSIAGGVLFAMQFPVKKWSRRAVSQQ